MSKINVDTWEPESGTAATLMASGDTVTVPSGASLVVASGATINITGATQTGFPAGGLTTASQWRLTTDFTGDAAPIASNLEEVDAPVGFGILGSSMTESSGIFTFPSTGYWLITFHASFLTAAMNEFLNISIYTTTNNSTYAKAAEANTYGGVYLLSGAHPGTSVSYIFDVTDTTQCKMRFDVDIETATVTTRGNTDHNETYMTFIKLADT